MVSERPVLHLLYVQSTQAHVCDVRQSFNKSDKGSTVAMNRREFNWLKYQEDQPNNRRLRDVRATPGFPPDDSNYLTGLLNCWLIMRTKSSLFRYRGTLSCIWLIKRRTLAHQDSSDDKPRAKFVRPSGLCGLKDTADPQNFWRSSKDRFIPPEI